MMPEAEEEEIDEEYHAAPVAEETPAEEAPAEEQNPDAVNEAMTELYPQAAEQAEEVTYTRRRKADEK